MCENQELTRRPNPCDLQKNRICAQELVDGQPRMASRRFWPLSVINVSSKFFYLHFAFEAVWSKQRIYSFACKTSKRPWRRPWTKYSSNFVTVSYLGRCVPPKNICTSFSNNSGNLWQFRASLIHLESWVTIKLWNRRMLLVDILVWNLAGSHFFLNWNNQLVFTQCQRNGTIGRKFPLRRRKCIGHCCYAFAWYIGAS